MKDYGFTLQYHSEKANVVEGTIFVLGVELHSMPLTISPFIFWDDSKTFTESILSLLVFLARNEIPGLLM